MSSESYSRIVKQWDRFRIIQNPDYCWRMMDLKGDAFCPKANPDIEPEVLKQQELDFEAEISREGVYGFRLEAWNPAVDCGWEALDSCWGFVGEYNDTPGHRYNHYIVNEMMEIANGK